MPPYIRIAELRPEHLTFKIQEQARKSLFILATWPDMKAVVKATMIRHMNLFVRVTSDNEILHAYVGNMSKKNRNENEASFENVGDFIGPPDLAIIRLNALTRPNKAAAGALEEALVVRSDQDKPTWLVSDVDRPFTSASPAYSESLWDFVAALPKMRMPPVLPRAQTAAIFGVEPVVSARPENASSAPEIARKQSKPDPRPEPGPKDDDDFGLGLSVYGYGSGVGKKKRFGRGDD